MLRLPNDISSGTCNLNAGGMDRKQLRQPLVRYCTIWNRLWYTNCTGINQQEKLAVSTPKRRPSKLEELY